MLVYNANLVTRSLVFAFEYDGSVLLPQAVHAENEPYKSEESHDGVLQVFSDQAHPPHDPSALTLKVPSCKSLLWASIRTPTGE